MTVARKLGLIAAFAIAFGFVESSVVVYLRSLYYPEGFAFPLKVMSSGHLLVELMREAATLVMLAAVGMLVGSKRWERFGYFVVAFGIWDTFYYVWLKVLLNWPASLLDWDILFLIPLPWIAPVVAPILISILMIVSGSLIVIRIGKGRGFTPNSLSWSLSLSGVILVLYSFMKDTGATLQGGVPSPYGYELLIASLVLFLVAFLAAYRNPA